MASGNQENSPDIKRVLVVDDDEVSRNLIAAHLGRMGVAELDLREDGEAAWAALQKKKYDLIVLDWKLPKLSGMALFNRIRRRRDYRTTPLLVVSGLLEKHDFRLLQEFPCTGLMEKPFTMVLFQNRVESLLKETIWYGQNETLINTLLDAVKHDGKKAEQLLKQILKKAPNPIPLALIAARRLTKDRMLKQSQAILESVLKLDDNCIIAMNELGKTLHLQGRHKQALDVLRQANRLSSQNLTRLCLIGEVELNLNDPESARAYFEKALEFDPQDSKAKAGMVVSGNLKEMLEAPDAMQVPRSFASLMNTMGIALVRNSNYAKGIEQYRSALAFLHTDLDAARVAFNLGLGFLRWRKPAEALPWFQKAEAIAPESFSKASGYVRQLLVGGVTEVGGVAELDLGDLPSRGNAGDAFGKVAEKKKKAPVSGDEAGDLGKVIPFPVAPPPDDKKSDDDGILEETVGDRHQVVLRPQEGKSAIDGFNEADVAAIGEARYEDDEPLAV